MEVKNMIAEIKQKMEERGGLKHVYFVACGGSKAAIFPGLYLLQSEAKTFSATTYTSNEFVHATPKELDERCLAVICSLKATPETVEAVKTANAVSYTHLDVYKRQALWWSNFAAGWYCFHLCQRIDRCSTGIDCRLLPWNLGNNHHACG